MCTINGMTFGAPLCVMRVWEVKEDVAGTFFRRVECSLNIVCNALK